MNGHLAWTVVVVCLVVLLSVNVGAVIWTVERGGDTRAALIASCERGNTLRVAVNVLLEDKNPLGGSIALVDCESSIP